MIKRRFHNWKLTGTLRILLIVALIGVSVGLWLYTRSVINDIQRYQRDYATSLANFYKSAVEEADGKYLQLVFNNIITKPPFSIIITNEDNSLYSVSFKEPPDDIFRPEPLDHRADSLKYFANPQLYIEDSLNFIEGSKKYVEDSLRYVYRIMKQMDRDSPPLEMNIGNYMTQYFHYGSPEILSKVMRLPFVEFGGIFLIILIGLLWILHTKAAEQRSLWVGMTKETAHQLGTPLSSLGGWLELLEDILTDKKDAVSIDNNEIIEEMKKDIDRLSRIASRFGQIGSLPDLQPVDIHKELEKITAYFRGRLPQIGRKITIEFHSDDLPEIWGNRILLNWAFENVIKNSLAAITDNEGKITISAGITLDERSVRIDFSDTGRGISPSDQRKVFKPGFTSKKRGWGLGLSFVRRIIEDYHRGRIVLIESHPDEGTTFRMTLPLHRKGK